MIRNVGGSTNVLKVEIYMGTMHFKGFIYVFVIYAHTSGFNKEGLLIGKKKCIAQPAMRVYDAKVKTASHQTTIWIQISQCLSCHVCRAFRNNEVE